MGSGNVVLGADNRGTLTGDVVVGNINTSLQGFLQATNQYALGGSVTNPYAAGNNVVLNNGAFQANASFWFQSDVRINSDSQLGGNGSSAISNLFVNGYGTTGSATNPFNTPVNVWVGGNNLSVFGSGSLNSGPVSFRTDNQLTVYGGLSGNTTGIQKWGGSTLAIAGSSNLTGSPAIGVYQGALQVLNGRTDQSPIGTGAVNVLPGGALRLAGPNVGPITLNSDGGGLAVLALDYNPGPNGALPALTLNRNGGPFDGTVAIDVYGFSTPLNMGTLGSGNAYLGAYTTAAYTGSLMAGAGNVYRLGTGGNNATLNINTPTLTGYRRSADRRDQQHLRRAERVPRSAGNTGTVALNAPSSYTGLTSISSGALQLGAEGALGTGGVRTRNSGALQADGRLGLAHATKPLTLSNNITLPETPRSGGARIWCSRAPSRLDRTEAVPRVT
jgi:autotransporter-associated beta strand protein